MFKDRQTIRNEWFGLTLIELGFPNPEKPVGAIMLSKTFENAADIYEAGGIDAVITAHNDGIITGPHAESIIKAVHQLEMP